MLPPMGQNYILEQVPSPYSTSALLSAEYYSCLYILSVTQQ